LHELDRQRPRFGYRQMTRLLRLEAFKRVHRIWRTEGLKVRPKPKKKRSRGVAKNSRTSVKAERMNQVCCWGSIFDRTADGQSLKWLSIVDEYTRRCIKLDVTRNMTSEDLINRLAELFAINGVPEHIRSDNGPEFIAQAIQQWLDSLSVKTLYVEPGSPWQNGYAGSFHSRLGDELLNMEIFVSVAQARAQANAYREV
jgi:putative transposase